jgi:plexin A
MRLMFHLIRSIPRRTDLERTHVDGFSRRLSVCFSMFSIVILSCCLFTVDTLTIDLIETEFSSAIEKVVLVDNHLYVGTVNALHRLSPSTLNRTFPSLRLGPSLDNPSCRQLNQCAADLMQIDYHWKILLPIDNRSLLVCGTLFQGVCQLIDVDLQLIVNSSLPVVANDRTNSTVGLFVPEKNLIYFGVTYTSEGVHRWQIPNIAGRSVTRSRFMKIVSTTADDESITRDDLSVRFLPRQQATFIVQYIFAFQTNNYVYFVTNQPNEHDVKTLSSKIIRFCREHTHTIIRSYAELPLICVNGESIVRTAQILVDDNDGQPILVGHFTRKDGTGGTSLCSWHVANELDRAFEENYRTCYSMGIGQRGLTFIKPNEPCRKDEVSGVDRSCSCC